MNSQTEYDKEINSTTLIIIAVATFITFLISLIIFCISDKSKTLNANMYKSLYRPYIAMAETHAEYNKNLKIIGLGFDLENFGKSPAKKVVINWHLFLDGRLIKAGSNKPYGYLTLTPGVKHSISKYIYKEPFYSIIKDGKAELTAKLTISYYGLDPDKQYYTEEKWLFNPRLKGFKILESKWE